MNKRYAAFSFIALLATATIIFFGCKKLNEATDLGGGLIPPVDNITTFDTSITVLAYNDTLGIVNDSIRLDPSEEFFLGKINSDPFFGKTDARLFLELKPPSYPFTFLNKSDSLYIDSVVLVLDYAETYGDSVLPQAINVYEIDQSGNFKPDSLYLIRQSNLTYSNLLGSKTITPQRLKDSVKVYKDTTISQLRIKLNNSFGTRLLSYDSTSNLLTGAYANDSVFRSKFKGFAVQSMNTGNAIMGFDLSGGGTKLAIYYKYEKRITPLVQKLDTTVAYFTFKTGLSTGVNSAAANHIIRDYTGTPAQASLNNGTSPDPILYLQNTPGTYASIKIPDLATINNRVIHRAELVMEQVYDISDSLYRSPDFLYLDAVDPTITSFQKFRAIPYDLHLNDGRTAIDYSGFGVTPIISTDISGNRIRTWKFNITRYVQHVLTQTQSLYELRLFPAFRFIEQFGIPPASEPTFIAVNPAIAKGRIRLGGGNHPAQKMKLRLIYSKL